MSDVLSKAQIDRWWNDAKPRNEHPPEHYGLLGAPPLCIHVRDSHEALRARIEELEGTCDRLARDDADSTGKLLAAHKRIRELEQRLDDEWHQQQSEANQRD